MVPSIQTDAQCVGATAIPRQRLTLTLLTRMGWSLAQRHRRSFTEDACQAIAAQSTPPEIHGAHHIPHTGACLVTCNHYTAPRFSAWWLAFHITAALAAHRAQAAASEVHWAMTAEWRYPDRDWRRYALSPLTRRLFHRVAEVFGFVTMPAMPPEPDEFQARVTSVLRTIRLARRLVATDGILGMAPQGRDTPHLLTPPPDGAGAFIALLVETGLPILPVGVAGYRGRVHLSFGPLFIPTIPADCTRRDRAVSAQVMHAIGAEIPPGLLDSESRRSQEVEPRGGGRQRSAADRGDKLLSK